MLTFLQVKFRFQFTKMYKNGCINFVFYCLMSLLLRLPIPNKIKKYSLLMSVQETNARTFFSFHSDRYHITRLCLTWYVRRNDIIAPIAIFTYTNLKFSSQKFAFAHCRANSTRPSCLSVTHEPLQTNTRCFEKCFRLYIYI